MLERVAMPVSRGSSRPRDWACISYISCIARRVLYHSCHLGSPPITSLPRNQWKVMYPLAFLQKLPVKTPSLKTIRTFRLIWAQAACSLCSAFVMSVAPNSDISGCLHRGLDSTTVLARQPAIRAHGGLTPILDSQQLLEFPLLPASWRDPPWWCWPRSAGGQRRLNGGPPSVLFWGE